jgi:hypothetical protein
MPLVRPEIDDGTASTGRSIPECATKRRGQEAPCRCYQQHQAEDVGQKPRQSEKDPRQDGLQGLIVEVEDGKGSICACASQPRHRLSPSLPQNQQAGKRRCQQESNRGQKSDPDSNRRKQGEFEYR